MLSRVSKMEVYIVPMLKDNYGYLLKCTETGKGAFVDIAKGQHQIAIKALEKHGLTSKDDFCIMTTHYHADHSGGNMSMLKKYPGLRIYGGECDKIPGCTDKMKDGSSFTVGNINISVIHAPCHTVGHVLYHCRVSDTTTENKEALKQNSEANTSKAVLFTGDTLFVGGVGAFFEGNAANMTAIVKAVLKQVHPSTLLYCGHEYGQSFLKNAAAFAPTNTAIAARLQWVTECRKAGVPAMPTTLADEIDTNMYVRAGMGLMKELVDGENDEGKEDDDVKAMAKVYDLI